jgi:excisionase family DNA binding protein
VATTIKKTFLRRNEVMELLGITKYQLECMVSSGAIRAYRLPGMKTRVYKNSEIQNLKKQYDG